MTVAIEGSGKITGLNEPRFRVGLNANQVLTGGVEAPVLFNAVEEDSHTAYTPGTGRWLPTVPGWYVVAAGARSGGGATYTSVTFSLYKNTTIISRIGQINVAGVTSFAASGSTLVHMNGTTDYLLVQAVSTVSAGTPQVDGLPSMTNFSGMLVRPD